MKKTFVMILLAGLAMLSCTKEAPVQEEAASGKLTFDIKITRPEEATKAVKSGWEDGDVVYVFFSEAEAPRYLEMKYSGGTWTRTQKNGSLAEDFSLTGGKMTAVYLPFGNDAWVGSETIDGQKHFKFDKVYYSYYLYDEDVSYTVSDGVVHGELVMKLPSGFVHFFMADPSATPEKAAKLQLWEKNLMPARINYVDPDASKVRQVSGPYYGAALPAFCYDNGTDKGYVFSGILMDSAQGSTRTYTFHLNNASDMSGRTASKHTALYTSASADRALRLPDAGSTDWTVEEHPAFDLGLTTKWATMNVGASTPSGFGDYIAWAETEPYYEPGSAQSPVWKTGKEYGYDWRSYRYADIPSEETKPGDNGWYYLNKYTFPDGGADPDQYNGIWYNSDQEFIGDGLTEIDPDTSGDDAARANWGSPWRMPALNEADALRMNTEFAWTTDYNGTGIAGAILTSLVPGYEGFSIFFPRAGMRWNTTLNPDFAYYYINCLGYISDAPSFMAFTSSGMSLLRSGGRWRCEGYPIRPVCDL